MYTEYKKHKSYTNYGGYSSRFGGNQRKGFGRNSYRSNRAYPTRRASTLDISKLINKAEPQTQEEYVAKHQFEEFEIDSMLKKNIIKKGFSTPLPIQDQAIPAILEGNDLIGIANTGTGKTAAFLVPLINKTLTTGHQKTIIITPTRELAQQIKSELFSLTQMMRVFSVICIGGTPIYRQMSDLRREHQFLIGTPGRLNDLLERRALSLERYNNVVIDEVDRLFDMGFSHDVRTLLDLVSKERQSLFFSATINHDVEEMVHNYSNNPVRISVKTRDTSANVDQNIIRVPSDKKMSTLYELLGKEEFRKILVFARTKRGVQRLADDLLNKGFRADAIHGNKSQSQRQRALRDFKENKVNILVATDVVARGIDIPNVSHVINYDLPETYEDYIHRIGRTGRANSVGKALSFV